MRFDVEFFALAVLAGCGGRSALLEATSGAAFDAGLESSHDAMLHPDARQPSDARIRDSGDAHRPADARVDSPDARASDAPAQHDAGAETGCVPDANPPCLPLDCVEAGVSSGTWPNGCGGTLDCGDCLPAGGPDCIDAVTVPPLAPNLDCGCVPAICADYPPGACGPLPDGCGAIVICGPCDAASPCIPATCASLGYTCGSWFDGCGGHLQCGTCDPCVPCSSEGTCPATFVSYCVAKTCAESGFECGAHGNGCGGVLSCGTCAGGLSCVGGACVPACH